MNGSFEAIKFRYGFKKRMSGAQLLWLKRDNVFAGNNC